MFEHVVHIEKPQVKPQVTIENRNDPRTLVPHGEYNVREVYILHFQEILFLHFQQWDIILSMFCPWH